ncbi:MAG: outer membrane beta-barrel protein [Acidobacteriota bacterium]|nr:outer membrane beta-barrel protein [Acidobacteriota bacterium]
MIKKSFTIFVMVMVVLAAASELSAGTKRKGFVFGFGLGGGYSAYQVQVPKYSGWWYTGEEIENRGNAGVATDFKIGIGLSEHIVLLYTNKVLWFNFKDPRNDDYSLTDTGASMFGIDYFFKTAAPSLYLLAGIGAGAWSSLMAESDSQSWIGLGICAGLGYEFSRHWTIEASLLYSRGGGEDDLRSARNPLSIMFMFNYLFY